MTATLAVTTGVGLHCVVRLPLHRPQETGHGAHTRSAVVVQLATKYVPATHAPLHIGTTGSTAVASTGVVATSPELPSPSRDTVTDMVGIPLHGK